MVRLTGDTLAGGVVVDPWQNLGMGADRTGAAEGELEAVLAVIRTAVDGTLDDAIARGTALTSYPYLDRSKPIPLAAELTADQRRLMETIATRSGLALSTVRKFRIPDPVQVRRRWLGIEPPGVLEKIVEVTDERAKTTVAMPLWRALRAAGTPTDRAWLSTLLPSSADQLAFAVEVAASFDAPYEIGAREELFQQPIEGTELAGAALGWLNGTVERVAAACFRLDPSGDGPAVPVLPATEDAQPGQLVYEVRSPQRGGNLVRLLLAALVESRPEQTIEARWEPLLTLESPYAQALFGAVAPHRRGAALARALERADPSAALPLAFSLLPALPEPAFVEAVAALLESPRLRQSNGVEDVRVWQAAWPELAEDLPEGVFRPLDPSRIVPPAPPRLPEAIPDRTPDALRQLDDAARARHALADLSVFVQLAEPERLLVARHVASELGASFEPIATLIGERHLVGVRHRASGYDLVLLPGETFEMGLTDKDLAEVDKWLADYEPLEEGDDWWREWLAAQTVAARPVRTIAAGPIAFGRTILDRAAVSSLLGVDNNGTWPSVAEPQRLARLLGFDLPSEVEWEQAARDGRGATFLYDAAAVRMLGSELVRASGAGLVLDRGEWVADDWHDDFTHAPASTSTRAWADAEPSGVYRGKFCVDVRVDDDGSIVLLLVAARAKKSPEIVGRDPFVRLVVRPDQSGRWICSAPRAPD